MSRLPVSYLDEARDEVAAVRARYGCISPNLGLELSEAIDGAVKQIVDDPKRWPLRRKGTRLFPLDRFPYLIVYEVGDKEITIVALQHTSRRPGYWSKRLSGN